ncbi:MAG: polynucleotide adenylyltransferase, partial [Bacillota bacterium]
MPVLVPALLARWLRHAADAADALGLEAALVGGAVRDLLLGREPTDIDLVVGGQPEDVMALAREIGSRVGLAAEEHDPFGTATLQSGAVRIDLAMRRREAYQRPGALPVVEPGGWEEDLLRRDFTVNALAWPLRRVGHGPEVALHREDLAAAPHALDDLQASQVRILHDASFEDDPTRLFRAARLAARLGFHLEQRTRTLALEAVAGGALQTISGPRLGQELRLTAEEGEALAAFRLLDDLGVWQA